jgi:F0F1-type ATP synthase assembly protein I
MDAKPQAQGHSARGLSAGLTFAVVVALFTWGGLWIDDQVGTRPLFVLVGVFLGLIGGTLHMLRVLAPDQLPFGRKPRKQEPADPKPPRS